MGQTKEELRTSGLSPEGWAMQRRYAEGATPDEAVRAVKHLHRLREDMVVAQYMVRL